jgi:hypothetical protein
MAYLVNIGFNKITWHILLLSLSMKNSHVFTKKNAFPDVPQMIRDEVAT